jgi:hypothetical protein
MKIRRSLLNDSVSVQSYAGEGAYGPVYAAAVTVSCNVETTRRLVRNYDGDEVVSESTLYVHPDDAGYFLPESLLTIASRESRVLTARTPTVRGKPCHTEVACT